MIRFIRSADVSISGRFGLGRFGQWIFRTRTFWPVDSSDKDVSARGYFGRRFGQWIFRPRTLQPWTFQTRTFRTMDVSATGYFGLVRFGHGHLGQGRFGQIYKLNKSKTCYSSKQFSISSNHM